jgi:hypothetical protein
MSGFGKRVDGPQGRRRSTREAVTLIGTAISRERGGSVLVEDLSLDGAKISGRVLPSPGEEILLQTDNLSLFGRIAWAQEDYRGIHFEE